jgi:hypothetical protein
MSLQTEEECKEEEEETLHLPEASRDESTKTLIIGACKLS